MAQFSLNKVAPSHRNIHKKHTGFSSVNKEDELNFFEVSDSLKLDLRHGIMIKNYQKGNKSEAKGTVSRFAIVMERLKNYVLIS
ncbi:MAG: hypothetical protein IKU28_08145 [Erysipelotrichaceae bacterium]|nr:hypothetical protein [Erysipelotrichaceae bacterium]